MFGAGNHRALIKNPTFRRLPRRKVGFAPIFVTKRQCFVGGAVIKGLGKGKDVFDLNRIRMQFGQADLTSRKRATPIRRRFSQLFPKAHPQKPIPNPLPGRQ